MQPERTGIVGSEITGTTWHETSACKRRNIFFLFGKQKVIHGNRQNKIKEFFFFFLISNFLFMRLFMSFCSFAHPHSSTLLDIQFNSIQLKNLQHCRGSAHPSSITIIISQMHLISHSQHYLVFMGLCDQDQSWEGNFRLYLFLIFFLLFKLIYRKEKINYQNPQIPSLPHLSYQTIRCISLSALLPGPGQQKNIKTTKPLLQLSRVANWNLNNFSHGRFHLTFTW